MQKRQILDRKVIFFYFYSFPNSKIITFHYFHCISQTKYFVFPLQFSIVFQLVTPSLWVSDSFQWVCQIHQKFPPGQGHRKKQTRILSSGFLRVYMGILGRWKGCDEGLVTDESVCPSLSPQSSDNGLQSLGLTVVWRESVHWLWASPESCSGPGDWWLLSVSNHSISKYWNSDMFWGELTLHFLLAPGWTSSDLPTVTLKFAFCKVGCFQQWISEK